MNLELNLDHQEISEGHLNADEVNGQDKREVEPLTEMPDMESLCGAIEAIIFMSPNPVPLTKLKNQIHQEVPLQLLHDCITRLQEDYEKAHHGIRLLEVAHGYQFRTKPYFAKYIQQAFKVTGTSLGPVALEVLAIIAYKQPIGRNEIDKIRGVDSSHVLRALMDRKLVKVTGRSEDLGRPATFGTTQEFLEVFNLKRLEDLPPEFELDSMAQSVGRDDISSIKSLIQNSEAARFDQQEIWELDELSKSISSISVETSFTKELNQGQRKEAAPSGSKEGSGTSSEGTQEGSIAAPAVRKSAFDIMEEFLARKEVEDQNLEAIQAPPQQEILDAICGKKPLEVPPPAPAEASPHIQEEVEFSSLELAPEGDEEWEEVEMEEEASAFIEEISEELD